MWWPKFEAELQNLPSDGITARPRRTDRDLIEELVDLVRNQSRSGELSHALWLTERQRTTAFQVMSALDSLGFKREGLKLESPDFRYTGETEGGREFTITVPSDIAADSIPEFVKSQVNALSSQSIRKARPHRKKATKVKGG
jgi:hypothetical protein